MRIVTSTEVQLGAVAQLGLDPTTSSLTSVEAIAAALRRAASFLCPCTSATLVRGVVEPMRGLTADLSSFRAMVQQTLEAMTALGDFIEHDDFTEDLVHGTATLLYGAPACFVARESGSMILLGITSSESSVLASDFRSRIEHRGYLRRLNPLQGEDLGNELRQRGFIPIPPDRWLQAPRRESAAQHLARMDRLLNSSPPSRRCARSVNTGSGEPCPVLPGTVGIGTHKDRAVYRTSQPSLWGRPVVLHRVT